MEEEKCMDCCKNAGRQSDALQLSRQKNKEEKFQILMDYCINAGARAHGMSYSQFMGSLKKSGIELNRKVLADLAMNHPEAFVSYCK